MTPAKPKSGFTRFAKATAYATGRPATFVLRRATAAETAAFRAPACAWRIATGATAVLGTAPAA